MRDAGGVYEESPSPSPDVECTWRTRPTRPGRYLIPAVEYWDIWFARGPGGELTAAIGGPTLGHRWVDAVVDEYGWGVQLGAHVAVPWASKGLLTGGEEDLSIRGRDVVLEGQRFNVPDHAGLSRFVSDLVEAGLLRSDDDVRRALSGDHSGYSVRHWQRRIREVTGLTRKQIAQLERARTAYRLLQEGVRPAECAARCGYSDQAHLTRSLRLFHGQTPARVLAGQRG